MSKIKSLTDSDLGDLQAKGSMNIFGHKITISEVMLKYEVVGGSTTYEAHSENNVCLKFSSSFYIIINIIILKIEHEF